ncbi:kinesin motor protein cin8, partial [Tulasnella sp. 408]
IYIQALTKTYPFDRVFGQEADQAMIYHDVVQPRLEEVVQGYNCKLFAYGQTGTGKTYTMQGDLTPSVTGVPAPTQGWPQGDMSAPAGSAQPMGLGGTANGAGGLKIFEEVGSGTRGVLIQGLEDTPVTGFNHAIALLRKGNYRRQIAATKFNAHSSRSQSRLPFIPRRHARRETKPYGLEGSTLIFGEHRSIPSRSLQGIGTHSLLLDSLGGRTKTCIIATVLPAKCNTEEALSTLGYAFRAKSIRNKPGIKQRMTRNGLLKEYVGEIEKPKADLVAPREKNGIGFSKESWEEMSGEHQQLKTLYEENRKQVEPIGSQMRAVREEFEQGMALLMKSEGRLKETKEKLASRRAS